MNINLCMTTEYSLLNSTVRINELMKNLLEKQYNVCAITDNNMYGAYKFYKSCIKNNIKPILGYKLKVESDVLNSSTFLLYAKNNKGYKNLLIISSIVELNNKKLIQLESLKKYLKDIVVVSHSRESDIYNLITSNNYQEAKNKVHLYNQLFETFFIGVKKDKYIDNIIDLGECVLQEDVYYLEENSYVHFEYLKAIGDARKKISPIKTDFYLKTNTELNLKYKNHKMIFNNIEKINKMCQVELKYKGYILPKYKLKDSNSKDYLLRLCKKGLQRRLVQNNIKDASTYIKRIQYELEVIHNMGFNDYFLIVWDFVKYAKNQDILVGPGRGSAASSIVSYALGITDVDPIKYNLLFERFLNPERLSMPDIDLDFPDDRRDEVIKYVSDKYGKNNVCHIVTFGTLQARSTIRDVARVMDLNKNKLNEILDELPKLGGNLKEIVKSSERFMSLKQDDEIKQLLDISINIEGLVRHTSTHAAGIIISESSLLNYTGLQIGLNDVRQSQFEACDLEEIGLLKMDFLGLRNLTIIKNIENEIKKTNKSFSIHKINYNDKLTFDILSKAKSFGVFQLESEGIRNVLKKMGVTELEDIIATLALYRPGPMENIDTFIKRKKGLEKIEYIHKDLTNILKNTYGIIVYQEQIMQIAYTYAKYSLGEADILRKAVSKKQKDILEKEREKFVNSSTKNGYKSEISNKIYDYIVKFANYGFNRAHSVSYAIISYQMAYLKANYTALFLKELLNNSIGSEKQMQKYIKECHYFNIEVLTPCINKSNNYFSLENNKIRFPLIGIKGINNQVATKIIDERDKKIYSSYLDFVTRNNEFINDKLSINLINSSCFDCFNQTKKTLIENMKNDILNSEYGFLIPSEEIITNVSKEEFNLGELIIREKDAISINLKYNIFMQYKKYIKDNKLLLLQNINKNHYNKYIKVIASIKNIKVIKTKNNDEMAFLELEDDEVVLDGVLFPKSYNDLKEKLSISEVFELHIKVDKRNDKIQAIINNLLKINNI